MKKIILFALLTVLSVSCFAASEIKFPTSLKFTEDYQWQQCNGNTCQALPSGWSVQGVGHAGDSYNYSTADQGITVKQQAGTNVTDAMANYDNADGDSVVLDSPRSIDYNATKSQNPNYVFQQLGCYLECDNTVDACFLVTTN